MTSPMQCDPPVAEQRPQISPFYGEAPVAAAALSQPQSHPQSLSAIDILKRKIHCSMQPPPLVPHSFPGSVLSQPLGPPPPAGKTSAAPAAEVSCLPAAHCISLAKALHFAKAPFVGQKATLTLTLPPYLPPPPPSPPPHRVTRTHAAQAQTEHAAQAQTERTAREAAAGFLGSELSICWQPADPPRHPSAAASQAALRARDAENMELEDAATYHEALSQGTCASRTLLRTSTGGASSGVERCRVPYGREGGNLPPRAARSLQMPNSPRSWQGSALRATQSGHDATRSSRSSSDQHQCVRAEGVPACQSPKWCDILQARL